MCIPNGRGSIGCSGDHEFQKKKAAIRQKGFSRPPDSCSCSSSETEAAQPNLQDLVKPLRKITANCRRFPEDFGFLQIFFALCSGIICSKIGNLI